MNRLNSLVGTEAPLMLRCDIDLRLKNSCQLASTESVLYKEVGRRANRDGELTRDEKIASMSLKDHFFEHLAAESQEAQFTILENVDSPANIANLTHVEVFHGKRGGGRFGLFP